MVRTSGGDAGKGAAKPRKGRSNLVEVGDDSPLLQGLPKSLRYWRWKVALDQIQRQRSIVALKRDHEHHQYMGTWPPSNRTLKQKEFVTQLDVEVAKAEAVERELNRMPSLNRVKRATWVDRLMLRLYRWVITGQ